MRFSLLFAAFLCIQIRAAEWSVKPLSVPAHSTGAAATGRHLYTWGKGLYEDSRKLGSESYGRGGCLFDVNSDKILDLILHRLPDQLIWLEGPRFQRAHIIDTEAEFANCLGTSLHGRRGILSTHRGLQVRFYIVPQAGQAKWAYREIYSFYTASYQAGLVMADMDSDGHVDILSGNYWIQSPPQFDLPWRLYAINLYNDTPEAAHMRLEWSSGRLLVSQGELDEGKVTLFTPPEDRKQLWREQPIAENLSHPVAASRNDDIIVAEGRRIWLVRGGQKRLLHEGVAIHTLLATSDGFLAIGAAGALRLKQLP